MTPPAQPVKPPIPGKPAPHRRIQYRLPIHHPEALREFRECFPEYSLSSFRVTHRDDEHLNAGTIDLAMLIRTDRNRKMTFHPLFEDRASHDGQSLHPGQRRGKWTDINSRPADGAYNRNSATSRMSNGISSS